MGVELGDGVPAGVPGVVLLDGARVQGDVGDAFVRRRSRRRAGG